jgi:hypothetical protein
MRVIPATLPASIYQGDPLGRVAQTPDATGGATRDQDAHGQCDHHAGAGCQEERTADDAGDGLQVVHVPTRGDDEVNVADLRRDCGRAPRPRRPCPRPGKRRRPFASKTATSAPV